MAINNYCKKRLQIAFNITIFTKSSKTKIKMTALQYTKIVYNMLYCQLPLPGKTNIADNIVQWLQCQKLLFIYFVKHEKYYQIIIQ